MKIKFLIPKRGFWAVIILFRREMKHGMGQSEKFVNIRWRGRGEHTMEIERALWVDQSVLLEHKDFASIIFNLNDRAEKRDRAPWYTFHLEDLPLVRFAAEATVQWRKFDGDDLKVLVNGKIKKNSKSLFRKNWVWAANPFLKATREGKKFEENLPRRNHIVEFWADQQPILHSVEFNCSGFIRIPTFDDPLWTGNFRDDSPQILLARVIFGEARDLKLSDNARVAVGWSVRNRVEDPKHRFGASFYEVIMKPMQYKSFRDMNLISVKDPRGTGYDWDDKAWAICHNIAGRVLQGEVTDPTRGANHFVDSSEHPSWAIPEALRIKIDTLSFYKL